MSKEIQTRGRGILMNWASHLGPTSNLMRLVFSSVTSTQTGQGVSARQVVACKKKLVCLSSSFFSADSVALLQSSDQIQSRPNRPKMKLSHPLSRPQHQLATATRNLMGSSVTCSTVGGCAAHFRDDTGRHRRCCYQIFCGSRQYMRD